MSDAAGDAPEERPDDAAAPDPAAAVLGTHDETLLIEDRATLARVCVSMVEQCARYLTIVSRHLDRPLYDNDAFADAVKSLALGNRRAEIRLLVIDSRPLVTTGHRLIELANRLPSFVSLRAPARQHRTFNEAILLADNCGYVHRQFSDRFEATASFNDKRVVAGLSDQVSEMWERGVPDTNFRRLHI